MHWSEQVRSQMKACNLPEFTSCQKLAKNSACVHAETVLAAKSTQKSRNAKFHGNIIFLSNGYNISWKSYLKTVPEEFCLSSQGTNVWTGYQEFHQVGARGQDPSSSKYGDFRLAELRGPSKRVQLCSARRQKPGTHQEFSWLFELDRGNRAPLKKFARSVPSRVLKWSVKTAPLSG